MAFVRRYFEAACVRYTRTNMGEEKFARKAPKLRMYSPFDRSLAMLTLFANAFDTYCSLSSRRERLAFISPSPEWISRSSTLAANRGIILRFPCFYRDSARNWMLRLFSASSSPFFLNRVGVVKPYIQMYDEAHEK